MKKNNIIHNTLVVLGSILLAEVVIMLGIMIASYLYVGGF